MVAGTAVVVDGAGRALVDEVHDLVCWLGVATDEVPAIVRAAFCDLAADRHMRRRAPSAIETEVLVAAATRAVVARPDFWFRSPPRMDPGSLHPAAAMLAPAGDVSEFVHAGRCALALLPPHDAGFTLLSSRFEFTPDDFAATLGMSQRRASQVVTRARHGFVGCAGAVLLWGDGMPRCPDLVEILDLTSIAELRPSAASLILHHGRRCRPCRARLWQVTEVSAAMAASPPDTAPDPLVGELSPLVRKLLGPGELCLVDAAETAVAATSVPHIERPRVRPPAQHLPEPAPEPSPHEATRPRRRLRGRRRERSI